MNLYKRHSKQTATMESCS